MSTGRTCSSDVSLVDDVARRRAAPSRTWISRRAISTAARSRTWRAARASPNSTSPAPPSLAARHVRSGRAPAQADARRGDPGYHLIGGGRRAFEAAIGLSPAARNWLARVNRSLGIGGYVGAIAVVAADPSRRAAAGRCSPLRRRALAALGLLGVPRRRFPPSTRRSRWSIAASASAFAADAAAGAGAARRRSRASAHAGRRADAADHARTPSKSRSSGWKSIISPARKAICISRCCPTGRRRDRARRWRRGAARRRGAKASRG